MENTYINLLHTQIFEKLIDDYYRDFLYKKMVHLLPKTEIEPFQEQVLKEIFYQYYLKEKAIALTIFQELNKELNIPEKLEKLFINQQMTLLDQQVGSNDKFKENPEEEIKNRIEKMALESLLKNN